MSKVQPYNSLYMIILDDDNYSVSANHCLMKDLWIDDLLRCNFIDGIEFYSLNQWNNKKCNLRSVAVDKPHDNFVDPSAYLLYNSLKLFLERSTAGFIYFSMDAVYINTPKFTQFIHNIISNHNGYEEPFLSGNCIEQRYFFKMHTLNAGIIMSRYTVQQILQLTFKWETSIILNWPAADTLGQVCDQAGYPISQFDTSKILGRPWRWPIHNDVLLRKEFYTLEKCSIPPEHLVSRAGELSNCNAQISRLNEVVAWAAGGKDNKTWFLEHAKEMMQDLPDDIGFYWDLRSPMLCKI